MWLKWSKSFREGREEIEDEDEVRPERSVTETTSANIEEFRNLTNDDPYKIDRKSSNAAWIASGDPSPTLSTGPVLIHSVEPRQTIDHQYCIKNCLQPVVDEIKNQRLTFGARAIKLHHDNGKPHFHKDVLNYLEAKGITVIPHPTHSTDLTPCDFWLFDLIKQNLSDQDDSES
ncbi:unnamed protein product [Rotaria sp. Silwood1]|nr:unnamed protein product [Rotaria sp. Silwood1]